MQVDWSKLAAIAELQEYFEADFGGFQARIEDHMGQLQKFTSTELDHLAMLRVLEVTNGCAQWGFRRQDPHCLPAEQIRVCMQTVIGFIKNKQIDFPNGQSLVFAGSLAQLIEEGRRLYQEAFKMNNPEAQREYYAYSTAQFLVYGSRRLHHALDLVKQEFEFLFTPYYIDRGSRYVAPYLEALIH